MTAPSSSSAPDSSAPVPAAPGAAERAVEMAALAARLRTLGPEARAVVARVGQLAGPETWRGRVADVFRQDLADHTRALDQMADVLELVARRIEVRAAELSGPRSASTGEFD